MMRTSTLAFLIAAFTLRLVSAGYGDLNDCSLPCNADVSGTNCTVSNWPCLCADGKWVDQMNACVLKNCNTTEEQEASYLVFAQLCAIFEVPLTATPEATFPASLLSANGSSSLSALGRPGPASATSIPTVSSVVSSVATSSDSSSSQTASSTSQSTTSAAVTATATQGSGNAGTSTRETDVWFALAVLLLACAAIL